MQVTRTSNRGWGLTVHEDVKKGSFIIEYVGELITIEEFHNRIEVSRAKKEEHNYYYMTVDNSRMIDAGPKGNIARFMNHSCDPNCETQKWTVNGDTRVGLFALKDISDGSELTFNYQFEAMGEVKQACLCGAKNCSGYIGEKPKSNQVSKKSSKQNTKEDDKKKKIKKAVKVWEDLCFRCYEDGMLLMCDWKTCPKVYHLACLGRDKMPREKWICPWHHCVECGKPAISHCIHCPNAYCKTHDNVLLEHEELGKICNEHHEDIEDLITFYRKIPGGISSVTPNPHVPLPEPPPDEEEEEKSVVEKHIPNKTDDELNPKVSNGNKKYNSYPCQAGDCSWVGRKTRLIRHYVFTHKWSEKKSLSVAKSGGVKQLHIRHHGLAKRRLPRKEGFREGLKVCYICRSAMHKTNMRRHFLTHHKDCTLITSQLEVLTPEMLEDGRARLYNRLNNLKHQHKRESESKDVVSAEEGDNLVKGKGEQLLTEEDKKKSLDHAQCLLCEKYLHKKSLGRHFQLHHPKEGFSRSKVSFNNPKIEEKSKGAKQNIETNGSAEEEGSESTDSDIQYCSYPDCKFSTLSSEDLESHRLEKGHQKRTSPLRNSKKSSLQTILKYKQKAVKRLNYNRPRRNQESCRNRVNTACEFEGCTYVTCFISNLRRHQRKYSHFLNSTPSTLTVMKPVNKPADEVEVENQAQAINVPAEIVAEEIKSKISANGDVSDEDKNVLDSVAVNS